MTQFVKQRENGNVSWGIDVGHPTMALSHAPRSIPLFHYEPPKYGHSGAGSISVAHEVFHIIKNMDDFYAALGYDRSAKNRQLDGEEFVWERYRRDNAKMSVHCLQIQIQTYLYNNSKEFRELYGVEYRAKIGKCTSSIIDHNEKHCANCPLYPTSASP